MVIRDLVKCIESVRTYFAFNQRKGKSKKVLIHFVYKNSDIVVSSKNVLLDIRSY